MSFIEVQDAQIGFEAHEPRPGYDFPEILTAMQQKYISLAVACYWIASEGEHLTTPLSQEAMEAAWIKLCDEIANGKICVKGANLSRAASRLLSQDTLSGFDVLPAEFIHPSDENYLFKSAWMDDGDCLDEAHVEIFYPELGPGRDALVNPRDPQNQWFGLVCKKADILAIWESFGDDLDRSSPQIAGDIPTTTAEPVVAKVKHALKPANKEEAAKLACLSLWPDGIPGILSSIDRDQKINNWCKEHFSVDTNFNISTRAIQRAIEKAYPKH